MREDLEQKLQHDFLFMAQSKDEKGIYTRWGCECSSGWFDIIYNCCKQIKERYEKEGAEIDFKPIQLKEKWGQLRFYYGYQGSLPKISAIDFLQCGKSIRFDPDDSEDSSRGKLRKDIAAIVRDLEERSKTTCECCGNKNAFLRTNLGGRLRTLCDSCEIEYLKKRERR